MVIRSLERGGAERQLCVLARGLSELGHVVTIVTFYSNFGYDDLLENSQVSVISLEKRSRWDIVGVIYRYFSVLQCKRPDIIHGYLPSGNIMACLGGFFFRKSKIIFGVRAATMHLHLYDRFSRFVYRLERCTARCADLIISNSTAGAEVYSKYSDRVAVIPNGIDTDYFSPSLNRGLALRQRWGIKCDQFVIGMVARIDPMKDHEVFIEAAAMLLKEVENVKFVCIGGGDDDRRIKLEGVCEYYGVSDSFTWVGECSDMISCYSALDIMTLASKGESFPNVVAEAMACGVCPVASEVGAVGQVIGSCGYVVPIADPGRLKDSWASFLLLGLEEKKKIENGARERIVSKYGIEKMLREAEMTLMNIL